MAGADKLKLISNPIQIIKGSSSYKIFKQAQFSFTEINRIYDLQKNKLFCL